MTPRIRIFPAGLAPRLAPNLALALALTPALFSIPAVTQAATIAVDADTVVIAADGLCSLREAIHNANADAQVDNTDCVAGFGFDVIQLGNEEAYVLPDADAFFPESGLPVITSTLRIEGNGSSIERSGACNLDGTKTADEFRLLTIQAGGTSVTLQDLTLRGGCADGGGGSSDGGAIWAVATNLDLQRIVVENNQAWDTGGGLIVGDSVTRIEDSTFRGNSAGGGGGGIGQSDGDLTLLRSTVSGNTAGGDGGGGIGTGGNTESMLTIVRNSTISGNTSTGAGGGGGGLGNTGDMRVDGSTVTGNSATGLLGGGGIGNAGILILNNSIVAGNGAGGDCSNLGLLAAGGVNFDSDGTCAAEDVDVTTVTAEELALRPLAKNGGSTETHDLAFGSVAIDAVLDCITTVGGDNLRDQRDFDRPQDGDGDGVERCDAGAVESSEVLVADGTCTLGDAIEAANADNVTVGGCTDQATGDDTILLDVDTVLSAADTVRSTLRFGAYAGLPEIAGGLEIRARNASVIERDEGLSCGVPDGPDEFRLLQMATPIDPPRLELAGVTLRGGCADKGGALLGFGRLDIVDSHFLYNTAISNLIADGGAVFASEADVTISGSYFRGNTALGSEAYGGAVYASDLASLTTSQFVENLAESTLDEAQGGALYTSGGVGELREVVFDTNQARGQTRGSGGGFRINFVDSMNQVVLSHNEAFGESVLSGADSGGEALGGGAYLEVVNLATDVTLVGNLARGGDADSGAGGNAEGGGLYLASEGTLRSLTFSDNRAEGGDSTSGTGGSAAGGGVRVDGDYRLENSTLALNEAVAGLGGAGNGTATGGGLLAAVGMTLGSSLLEQNTTDVAGAVTNSDCGDLGMHLTSLGYNAVAAPTNCTFSATGDQTGVASSLLPLGDHGCASTLPDGRCIPTHPVALGSDAIDKGSCTASGVTADIREFVRPIDFTGITDGDDGCDVGAYESRDLDEGAGDGVEDGVDNCPNDINPSQQDGDGDGYGDECDLCVGDDDTGDADGDGVCADLDCADSNPSTSSCTIFVDGFESGDTTAWSATVF